MIGDRIARLARRLVRAATYQAMVAPAIADLQHETRRGRVAHLRGYAGVARALVGAGIDDLCVDWRQTFTGPPVRRAARVAAAVIVLQNVLFFAMWRFDPRESPAAFILLLPATILSAWPAAMLPAAAIVSRRRGRAAKRAVLSASIASGVILLAVADQGVTRTNQQFRETIFAARGGTGPLGRGTQERTVRELWNDDGREARTSLHLRLTVPVSTAAWALLGLSVARASGVVIGATAAAGYAFFLLSPFLAPADFAATLPVWSPWIPVALLLALASATQRVYVQRAS